MKMIVGALTAKSFLAVCKYWYHRSFYFLSAFIPTVTKTCTKKVLTRSRVVHKYTRRSNLFLFSLVGTMSLFLCLIMLILLLWSRILLAEAELAARALEAAGARDESLTRSLLEARTLLDEANKTLSNTQVVSSPSNWLQNSYLLFEIIAAIRTEGAIYVLARVIFILHYHIPIRSGNLSAISAS